MKRQIVGLLTVLSLFALACGFLDPEVATVTYEAPVPVDFTVDANELCPPGETCDEAGPNSPQDVELGEVDFDIDIDIVEASGKEELRGIASRLRSIEITSIGYEVSDNDLTFDLPPMEIYVAPVGSDDESEQIHLTTIPTMEAGIDGHGDAVVEDGSREASSEIFKELEFTAIPSASPVVKEGQPFPPAGSADIVLTINFKLTANPTDDN